MKMGIFRLKRSTQIVLGAMMISIPLLLTTANSAASSTIQTQTELAYVTNADSNTISVIDTTSKKVLDRIPVGAGPRSIAVTPNGKEAYVVIVDGVQIIDAQRKEVTSKVKVGGIVSPYNLAMTPDGKQVYVAVHQGVSIIETETHKMVKTISVGKYNQSIAISPDGTQAYVTHDGHVSVIDITKQEVVATIAVGDSVDVFHAIAFTPDGKQAYVASRGSISIIDTVAQAVFATIDTGKSFSPHGIVFTPNGKQAYVAMSYTKSDPAYGIAVINTSTRQMTKIVPVEKKPLGVAMTADGKEVYVTNSYRNTVSVIDTQTQIVRNIISVGEFPHQISLASRPQ
jgi:YVTN family beta-propeller protein